MKTIHLTKGQVAWVSDEDYVRVSQHKWYASFDRVHNRYVAKSKLNGRLVVMHRYILRLTDPKIEVDHNDRNPLNNQRENIRICSRSQNLANKPKKPGCTSQYKGVSYHARDKRWSALIQVNKKRFSLGSFTREADAAKAYNEAAAFHYGEFAVLNNILL